MEGSGDRILPIPVDERSKARVCGRSLAGIAGSSPAGGMDVCVVCCILRTIGKSQDNQDKEVQTEHKKNSQWGRDFLHPYTPALGPTQPSIQWVPRLPPPFIFKVKERIEIYLYSPSGTSWPVIR